MDENYGTPYVHDGTDMANQSFPGALTSLLEGKGFTRSIEDGEVVYTRAHLSDARMRVLIYTRIPVRGGWQPASKIRIVTLFVTPSKTYPIGRFPPVAGCGIQEEALNRILETARAAYARGSEWLSRSKDKDAERNQVKSAGGYKKVEVPKTPLDGF